MQKLQVLIIIILLGLGIGWVKNLGKFIDCDFEAPYKAEVIYGLGIVTPIGGITGYLNIEDGTPNETQR